MNWAVYQSPGRVVLTWPGAAPLRLTADQARALAAGLLVIAESVGDQPEPAIDFDAIDMEGGA